MFDIFLTTSIFWHPSTTVFMAFGRFNHCRGVQRARENLANMFIHGSAKCNKKKRKKTRRNQKRERRTEKEDNVKEWKWL
jgi:hypothetical protein